MRHVPAVGIVAGLTDLDTDARQRWRIHTDPADFFPCQVFSHRDRHETAPAADFLQDPFHIVFFKLDNPRQLGQNRNHVFRLFGHQNSLIILNVDGQIIAVAVNNEAAWRRNEPEVDTVFLGQHQIAFRLDHLQVVHPPDKAAEHRHFCAGQQRRPAGKDLRSCPFRAHVCPIPATRPTGTAGDEWRQTPV